MSPRRLGWEAVASVCSLVLDDSDGHDSQEVDLSDSQMAAGLSALAHPARLRILTLTVDREDREVFCSDLMAELGVSQGTVSKHLGVLVKAGLLTRHRRGQGFGYDLVPERLRALCAGIASPISD